MRQVDSLSFQYFISKNTSKRIFFEVFLLRFEAFYFLLKIKALISETTKPTGRISI